MCTDVIAVHLGRSASDLWRPSKNSLLYGKETTTRLTTNGYAVHIRRLEIQEAVHDFTVKISVLLQAYDNDSKWAINGPVEIRGRASMIPQQRRIAPRVDRQQPADIWSRVSSANTLFRPGTVSPVLPPSGRRCWCTPFRHRSRRVVTGGLGRPGGCPPPRALPVGRPGGSGQAARASSRPRGGTELAVASGVDTGLGRCRGMAPDRFTGFSGTTWT
jgi:hypothetical protein